MAHSRAKREIMSKTTGKKGSYKSKMASWSPHLDKTKDPAAKKRGSLARVLGIVKGK